MIYYLCISSLKFNNFECSISFLLRYPKCLLNFTFMSEVSISIYSVEYVYINIFLVFGVITASFNSFG